MDQRKYNKSLQVFLVFKMIGRRLGNKTPITKSDKALSRMDSSGSKGGKLLGHSLVGTHNLSDKISDLCRM